MEPHTQAPDDEMNGRERMDGSCRGDSKRMGKRPSSSALSLWSAPSALSHFVKVVVGNI